MRDDTLFLLPKLNRKGEPAMMLYQGNMNPVNYITRGTFKKCRPLLKMSRKGRFTLNLSKVRQAHGNTSINKLYNQSRKN
jgi:hypothetical protein